MSLDLIKKQKANIAKEKKKVTESDLFSHPLAYQPVPKGKENALKEELDGSRKGTLDLLKCYRKKNGRKVCVPSFKIAPDKDAVGLVHSGIRPFVSGKRGGHVSDVYLPNRSGLLKKNVNYKNSSKFLADSPARSFPGYRGTAELRVKVVRKPGEPGYTLRDRLGDGETDLPRYEKADIYNLGSFEPDEVTPPETYPQLRVGKTNLLSPSVEEENKEGVNEEKKYIPANFDPYGTTVKLSFVKNLEPVQVLVEEEEETEESLPILSFKSDLPYPTDSPLQISHVPKEEVSPLLNPLTPSNRDSGEQWSPKRASELNKKIEPIKNKWLPVVRINSPVPVHEKNVEEEEEPLDVPYDYQPITDYAIPLDPNQKIISEILHSSKGTFHRKAKKFWDDIQSLRAVFLRKSNVDKIEFAHNLKSEITPSVPLIESIPPNVKYSSWFDQLISRRDIHSLQQPLNRFKKKGSFVRRESFKRSVAILSIGTIFALTIPIGVYVQKIIEAKNRIEISSEKALDDTNKAKNAILSAKPEEARRNFATAYNNFLTASVTLDEAGGVMLNVIKVLPGGGRIKSGENILEAGKHLTSAGQIVSEAFDLFLGEQGALKKKLISTDNLSTLKELTSYAPPERQDRAQTLTEAILFFQEKLGKAKEEMVLASGYIDKVDLNDLPEDKRGDFLKLKNQLPEAINGINSFSEYSNIILSVLGHNQSKQYLFLFQNNDEMRATGGFIGTYGIIKIEEGNISQLMIDGIYNPDGQLKERVIPPKPIQKMSATWSMHDANWWPDFPKSAEKIAWFYEKTGGPSVDGVIAFTPKLMEDLLKITGPINHQKYGVTISSENFVEVTQQKVEKDYDKKLNRPKQILADLAPLVLEKIFNSPPEKWIEVLRYFSENLEKRSAMMYFFDYNVQKTISELGWSGEILDTPKDYLSVINTNISGQKTDKMIEQKITHVSEIKEDGSIVDTVTITRSHHGGKEKYEWYNAVNSDWLRVYVPKGSELLHAEGYTREVDSEPVDYQKLGFIEDEMVVTEESGTNTDPHTGTRIYEDSGKTVFANWTYVSPGETLTVKYSYLLPWKLAFDDLKKPADSYSLLLQKQSGDESTTVASRVTGLENYESLYHYPDNMSLPEWTIDEKFDKDIFAGVVLVPKGTKLD